MDAAGASAAAAGAVTLEPAGLVTRLLAAAVDAVALAAMSTSVRFGLGALGDVLVITPALTRGMGTVILWVATVWLVPAYHVGFWALAGRTPGKWLLGLRVVCAATGRKPGVARSFVRFLAYTVSIAPLLVGVAVVAFDPRRRAWHDRIAGTLVVYERTPARRLTLRLLSAGAARPR